MDKLSRIDLQVTEVNWELSILNIINPSRRNYVCINLCFGEDKINLLSLCILELSLYFNIKCKNSPANHKLTQSRYAVHINGRWKQSQGWYIAEDADQTVPHTSADTHWRLNSTYQCALTCQQGSLNLSVQGGINFPSPASQLTFLLIFVHHCLKCKPPEPGSADVETVSTHIPLPLRLQPHIALFSHSLSVTSYLKYVLEQKAGARLKTHTPPQTCINEHIVPGLVSTSWALALIDALTWQSCQRKWQIHFAGFTHCQQNQKSQAVSLSHHHPPSAAWLAITLTSGTGLGGPCTKPVIGYIKADMTTCDISLCGS